MSETAEQEPFTDVDDFEVVAESDTLTIACPDLPCEARQTVAEGWHATIGDIIWAARRHEHQYPDRAKETSRG
ncbi:hypothetical protein [Nonomuraea wenchangensis]|uniref:hypothetical protein n=1 Tax=Nonomuraea wenchangensis TaxID=568860 RepID=UPI00331BADA5